MEILIWPHPTLKLKSSAVTAVLEPGLIEDMAQTMLRANGLGLSAIQVGIPKTFFLALIDSKVQVFVNPSWIPLSAGRKVSVSEGCLSLPGIFEKTSRYPKISVSFADLDLNQHVVQMSGTAAQIVQHECEHLQGQIFLDKLDVGAKDRARKKLFGRVSWSP